MTVIGPADRAVEILRHREDGRWTVGSGYLVGGRFVLSAAHNVQTGGIVDDEIIVRRLNGAEHATTVLAVDTAEDLALLEVAVDAALEDLPPVRFARIDRTQTSLITHCWAIGYPRWKEHSGEQTTVRLRDSVQVEGVIPPGSNLRRGLFELRTTSTPLPLTAHALSESEWQGMSGAVVFSDDSVHGPLAVGVVTEHHAPEGSSALTVAPLRGLVGLGEGTGWWWRLGLDNWVVLPRAEIPLGRAVSEHMALRRPLSDFTDREQVIAQARVLLTDRLAETTPVVVLYGMAGVGKTALANHIAHRFAPTFPHARILVDLGGGGTSEATPDAAMVQILQTFGMFGEDLPRDPVQRLHTVQRLLRAGPSLLVLDNVTRAHQILPLLPESPGSAAIVTSRTALTSLEGADRLPIDPLPGEEGLRLLERIVGPEVVARDRDAGRRIVSFLGGLPLAIRIAAADIAAPAMRHRPLAFHAARLADEDRRISHLDGEDKGVRSSFEISYRALRPDTARLFRHLGVLAGTDFVADLAANTADIELDHAERLLGELADRQLVEITGSAGDRYRLHDLLRLYARERAAQVESEPQRRSAFRRSLEWYAQRLDLWMSQPGAHERPPAPAVAWFAEEHLNVHANVRSAFERQEWDLVLQISGSLYGLLFYRGHWEAMESTKAMAVDAARQRQDEPTELGSLIHLAEARRILGRSRETPELYERALEIAQSLGDEGREGWILTHFGDLQCDLGVPQAALQRYAEAEAIYRRHNDIGATIWLAAHIADAHRQLEQPADAARVLEEALAESHRRGDPSEIAWCEWHLALAYAQLDLFDQAEATLAGAITFHRTVGDQAGLATMLGILGEIHLQAGRPAQAREALIEALELVRAIDAPSRVAELRARLERIAE